MESLLEKLLATGGPSVVVVVCVYIMLNHMKDQSELNRQLFREIHGDNLSARAETKEVIRDNTAAMRLFAIATKACNVDK
jgi:hypothetical protein